MWDHLPLRGQSREAPVERGMKIHSEMVLRNYMVAKSWENDLSRQQP